MVVDSTLQIGVRRNVPIRYDRDLVAKTVKAMERITEIRSRRERAFYKRRMAGKRKVELALARKLVAENEHLLPRMRGSEKRRLAQEQQPLEAVEGGGRPGRREDEADRHAEAEARRYGRREPRRGRRRRHRWRRWLWR